MSLRFVLGVVLSALITNFLIAFEIERSKEIMAQHAVWQYMDSNIPLRLWALAFALIGAGKIIALALNRDTLARWFCFASFDLLGVLFALTVLAYFQGLGPAFTLILPILLFGAMSSEGLYLVLSSYDVLDRIRFRQKLEAANVAPLEK